METRMVRLADLTPGEQDFLLSYDCPAFDIDAFVTGPPLRERRVALITTAGLRRKSDRSYSVDAVDYRLIPADSQNEIVMDHVSSGYDRTGFAQDFNIVLPAERLRELAADGVIAGAAEIHYSFMGAGNVPEMQPAARQVGRALHQQGIDSVVLAPV